MKTNSKRPLEVGTFSPHLAFGRGRSQKRSVGNKVRLLTKERIGTKVMLMDRIALILTVVGALNWGSVGLFKFDLVAWLFGGQDAILSRIIYTVVALAGVWCISLIFRAREDAEQARH